MYAVLKNFLVKGRVSEDEVAVYFSESYHKFDTKFSQSNIFVTLHSIHYYSCATKVRSHVL